MKKLTAFVTGLLLLAVLAGINAVDAKEKTKQLYKDAYEMVDAIKPGVNMISVARLKEMQKSGKEYFLVDIREPKEYKEGNIEGSLLIPRGILEFKIIEKVKELVKKDLKKSDSIVLYCKKGDRSVLSADALQKIGFTNVMALEGGWEAWTGKDKVESKPAANSSSKAKKPKREGC